MGCAIWGQRRKLQPPWLEYHWMIHRYPDLLDIGSRNCVRQCCLSCLPGSLRQTRTLDKNYRQVELASRNHTAFNFFLARATPEILGQSNELNFTLYGAEQRYENEILRLAA